MIVIKKIFVIECKEQEKGEMLLDAETLQQILNNTLIGHTDIKVKEIFDNNK